MKRNGGRLRGSSLGRGALVFSVSVLAAASAAQALEVTVTNLRSTEGDVVVCLWRPQDPGFPNCGTGQPFMKETAPAAAATVTFAEVAPGEYAVSLFHDETRSGAPETNLLGMPTSGIGLANNPQLGMSNRPSFDKARITLPEAQSISIEAQYLF